MVPRKKNSRFNELLGSFYDPMFLKYMFKAKINGYPYFKQVAVPSKELQGRKFIALILCKIFSLLNNPKALSLIQYTPDNSNLQGTDENGSS